VGRYLKLDLVGGTMVRSRAGPDHLQVGVNNLFDAHLRGYTPPPANSRRTTTDFGGPRMV